MKITAQDDVILTVLDSLDDTAAGQDIIVNCFIEYQLDDHNSFIIFVRKDGKRMADRDIAWLESLVKDCMQVDPSLRSYQS